MTERIAASKKDVVRLDTAERERLDTMIRTGKRAAQMLMKARILLAADSDGPCLSDSVIVERLGTSRSSVERVRGRLVEEGLDPALVRKPQARPSRELIFDGAAEAKLVDEAAALNADRNARHATVNWRFKTAEARVKLKRLYPRFE